MTRKKRARRDARRAPAPAPTERAAPEVLVIPHPGPATLASGWRLAWRTLAMHLRAPLALWPLLLATLVVFASIKMALAGLAGGLLGISAPDIRQPAVADLIDLLLWNAAGCLVAPWALAPWLAARVHRAHGLPVSWRLVLQPFAARWGQLLALGAVWLVVLALVLAAATRLQPAFGSAVALAGLVGAWLAVQVVMGLATAAVWRDGLSAGPALARAGRALARSWRPLPAVLLAWFIQAFVLLTLVGMAGSLAMPLAFGHPAREILLALALLAVLGFLVALWYLQWAALELALLDWGARPS